jgi:hypothetical protein
MDDCESFVEAFVKGFDSVLPLLELDVEF